MRSRLVAYRSFTAGIIVLSLVAIPRAARADGFVTPFVGINFGGATDTTLTNAIDDNSRANYGVSFGWMGAGIFGAEGDLAYAPRFFAPGANIGRTNVFTAMGNVIIGIPFGGQSGGGIRPYVVGGVGLLRTNVATSLQALALDRNSFGWDAGVGVNGYFSDHFGIRGDVRYFRDFSVTDANTAIGVAIGQGRLDFWRGSIGFVVRY